jgi:hypothetical protein
MPASKAAKAADGTDGYCRFASVWPHFPTVSLVDTWVTTGNAGVIVHFSHLPNRQP